MRPGPLLFVIALAASLAAPASADIDFLAPGRTFEALRADPRWPRFAASWQEYDGDAHLASVTAVALGETFAIIRDEPARRAAAPSWEIGVQAGVFATFEPLEESQPLFNSDWQVGLYAAGRRGRFSGMIRLWHQSSHLGDEFILRNPEVSRVNFTFESLSGIGAFEPTPWSRVYAGAGWTFDETPVSFGDWFLQYGLELRWPRTIWDGRARPFVAIDVQHWEPTNWQADVSLVAGVELVEPSRPDAPAVRVIVEFYDGRNVNGQFYTEDARYVGAGLQLRL